MKQTRLFVAQTLGRIAGKEELKVSSNPGGNDGATHVGILVDGTRDKTRNVVSCAEDLREGVGERRGGLDRCKVEHSGVVAVASVPAVQIRRRDSRVGEAKDILDLVDRQCLRHENDISVEGAATRQVTKTLSRSKLTLGSSGLRR
jgi:hypothetical protein